jgi:3-dehydroquinate synthase
MGYLDTTSTQRVINLLQSLGFDLFANEMLHTGSDESLILLEGLEEFREHLGGELAITLLKGIGKGFEVHEVNLPRMIDAIYELQERHAQGAPKIARLIG